MGVCWRLPRPIRSSSPAPEALRPPRAGAKDGLPLFKLFLWDPGVSAHSGNHWVPIRPICARHSRKIFGHFDANTEENADLGGTPSPGVPKIFGAWVP
jgi:hypothetical protein